MRPFIALALILSLTATTCDAGLRRRQPRLIAGSEAAQQADRTLALSWTDSLDDALARARDTRKLVLWVHMLGRIDGPT